jgi:two-component system, response regulator PdtaR
MICEIVHYGMAVPPHRPPSQPGLGSFEHTAGSTARILIVEDDFLVGISIEETLLEAGHDVVGLVATGEEAVEKGVLLRPDLVLMDIRLAGEMTGIEAAVQLRREGVPSLFASAHSDPGIKEAGVEAEPLGWLHKPFSSSALTAAVDLALARLKRH